MSEGEDGFGEEDLVGKHPLSSPSMSTSSQRGASGGGGDSSKSVARRIKQDTFNAAVEENMDEFEMNREDAVAEAIQEFRLQDASLENVDTSAAGR